MSLLGTLFGFEGRISRSTFWLCALAVALLDIALWLVTGNWIRQTYPEAAALAKPGGGLLAVGLPLLIAAVLSVWAGLALKVKRLHDRGRSGFWLLAGLVPVLGWLWLFWEVGLAPGKPKGARFDRGASRADLEDEPAPEEGAGWMAPAAVAATAGGLALAAEEAAHADEPLHHSEVAPESGYGVIAPDEAPAQDEPHHEPAAELAEPAETPADAEPYTAAEAAQVTQAQIADYLASVDHETPAAPEPEAAPVHAEEAHTAHAEEVHAAPAEPAPEAHHAEAVEHSAEAAVEPTAEPAHDDHHPAHP